MKGLGKLAKTPEEFLYELRAERHGGVFTHAPTEGQLKRLRLIVALRRIGHTHGEVAEKLEISLGREYQICQSGIKNGWVARRELQRGWPGFVLAAAE